MRGCGDAGMQGCGAAPVTPSERSEARDLHFTTAGADSSTALGMTSGARCEEKMSNGLGAQKTPGR
jgi:hypothetical protein